MNSSIHDEENARFPTSEASTLAPALALAIRLDPELEQQEVSAAPTMYLDPEDAVILLEDDNIAIITIDGEDNLDSIIRMDEEARRHNETIGLNNETRKLTFCYFLWHKLRCKYFVPLCLVAGATILIMMACGFQFEKETLPPFLVKLIFESRNGWDNVVVADIPKWHVRGTGRALLQLEVLNGLDESWQSYLTRTIEDWNQGDPADVLELTVTKLSRPNPDCDFVRGKIMMCNSDYGPTDFHGMNHILVRGTTITGSLAKLNEHYMKDASRARKEYTICHELGHAFGLPHADENHFNINLGNCMDYTNRPWSNRAPDKHTFELLQKMYDTTSQSDISSSISRNRPESMLSITKASRSATIPAQSSGYSDSGDDNGVIVPVGIAERAKKATAHLESNFGVDKDASTYEGWVALPSHENTAAFQMDLGDGFSLQSHFLLVSK